MINVPPYYDNFENVQIITTVHVVPLLEQIICEQL